MVALRSGFPNPSLLTTCSYVGNRSPENAEISGARPRRFGGPPHHSGLRRQHLRLHRHHTVQVAGFNIPADAASIERGRYLATTRGCTDCHGADYGGNKVIDDPLAGEFHGPNLTRGHGGLSAEFSDLDYVRAIRHGLTRDGRALALMPSHEYTTMADEDLAAMIAYLKTVPAVDKARGAVAPGPLIRALMLAGQVELAADEIDHAAPRMASITPAISVEYGAYLAAGCTGCHGANLSGGKIPGTPPDWPAAANLTPHETAGSSKWTKTQFVEVLRTGQRPDGSKINPIMPANFS